MIRRIFDLHLRCSEPEKCVLGKINLLQSKDLPVTKPKFFEKITHSIKISSSRKTSRNKILRYLFFSNGLLMNENSNYFEITFRNNASKRIQNHGTIMYECRENVITSKTCQARQKLKSSQRFFLHKISLKFK